MSYCIQVVRSLLTMRKEPGSKPLTKFYIYYLVLVFCKGLASYNTLLFHDYEIKKIVEHSSEQQIKCVGLFPSPARSCFELCTLQVT